jgi:purine-binding chemotaxis protein CheW
MRNTSQNNEYLSFEIDNELFGISLTNLNQIIEEQELTKVPMSSDLMEGIIHHNNKLLPIVNFHKWLTLKNEGSGEQNNILIVEVHSGEETLKIGLKVDKVLEVVHFEAHEIEKVPEIGDGNTKYIKGAARYLEKFIMLIDVDNLFTSEELASIKQSSQGQSEDILEEIAREGLLNIYLSFTIGKEKLVVDANKVVEILDMPEITPVPGSGSELAGVLNIRGNILPVLDTRIKFNINLSEKNQKITTVMVLEVNANGEQLSVGAIVDSVTDIIEINDENINKTVSLDLPFNPEYLTGVAKIKDDFIQLMSIDKVFELNTIK